MKRGLDQIIDGGEAGNKLVMDVVADEEMVNVVKGDNTFKAEGSARIVSWKPNDQYGGLDVNGSTARPAFIALAHELAHAHDAVIDNKMDFTTWFNYGGKSVPNSEKYATHWENKVRSENGISLRAYYTETVYKDAAILNRDNTSMFYKRLYETSVEPQKFSRMRPLPYEY